MFMFIFINTFGENSTKKITMTMKLYQDDWYTTVGVWEAQNVCMPVQE